ncbi:hypothetical protein SAMN04487898_11171 [Pedobacter sp. ok626]|uniref:hypothetical protein n=1 Tax=Pedobacter sp. ok626 TaxID=1761882 RepID=UPI000881F6D5|nr:hypothetical protein [Pedobacter sp. ok626]SDK73185.1 hypothetical protein SAMN04487898_11171 [Pedobacter sp. ok626]
MKGKSTFILLILSVFFWTNPWPKEIDVSGKVTCKNGGKPLLRVSVVIQETKNEVVSSGQPGIASIIAQNPTPCVLLKLTT